MYYLSKKKKLRLYFLSLLQICSFFFYLFFSFFLFDLFFRFVMNKDEDEEDETHQNSISSFDLRAFWTYNFFFNFYFSVCDDEMSLRIHTS